MFLDEVDELGPLGQLQAAVRGGEGVAGTAEPGCGDQYPFGCSLVLHDTGEGLDDSTPTSFA